MANTKIVLTEQGHREAVESTMRKAVDIFAELKDGEFNQYLFSIRVTEQKPVTREVGFFNVHTVTEYVPFQTVAIMLSEEGSEATLESYGKPYDNAALWIAGQIEQLYTHLTVHINDPTKIGTAIGWKCAYCGTLNQQKQCTRCGAQRAW